MVEAEGGLPASAYSARRATQWAEQLTWRFVSSRTHQPVGTGETLGYGDTPLPSVLRTLTVGGGYPQQTHALARRSS